MQTPGPQRYVTETINPRALFSANKSRFCVAATLVYPVHCASVKLNSEACPSGAPGLQAAPLLGLLMLAVHSGHWSLPHATITCGNGNDSTKPTYSALMAADLNSAASSCHGL